MSNSPKSPFLLGVVEDEINAKNPPPFYFMNPDERTAQVIPDDILSFFRQQSLADMREERIRQVTSENFPSSETNEILSGFALRTKERFSQILYKLQSIDPKIRESLIDSQVPLSLVLLINSEGGDVEVSQDIQDIMLAMRRRKGGVAAYATSWLFSAAANIWSDADRNTRFALRDTQAMWHTPEYKSNSELPAFRDEDETEVVRQELIDFFDYHATDGPTKNQIIATLEDGENTEAEVCLSGAELGECGLAQTVFAGMDAMEKALYATTGWQGIRKRGVDPIAQFFHHSMIDAHTDDSRKNGTPRAMRAIDIYIKNQLADGRLREFL